MARESGVQVKAASKRLPETATYASVAATTPTRVCPMISEDLKNTPEFDQQVGLAAQAGRGDAEIIRYVVGGPVSAELWWEGLEYLFLCAMGFECPTVYTGDFGSGSGGSPAADSTDAAWHHVFELDDHLEVEAWQSGERAVSSGTSTDPTYWTSSDHKVRCLDYGVDNEPASGQVTRYSACMVNGFQLNVSPDKVSIDWDLIGRNAGSNAMNNTSWAVPDERRATFRGLRVYISTHQTGASWTYSGNEYNVADLTLKLENGLKRVFESGSTSEYCSEPIREATRKVSGTIKLARYVQSSSSVLRAYLAAGTALTMMIELSGEDIVTSHPYRYRFILPRIKISDYAAPVTGPGVIEPSFNFVAEKPTGGHAWFEDIVGDISIIKDNEMFVEMVNTVEACLSRDRQSGGVTLP